MDFERGWILILYHDFDNMKNIFNHEHSQTQLEF